MDETAIVAAAKECGTIVTVEEHQVNEPAELIVFYEMEVDAIKDAVHRVLARKLRLI